ncbi:ATP binding protein, putative [Ricinus communis]|uniref:ATP binding protein, putative n=1 Tax=Ricinus communis TaxID=3988 RepID=B9SE29_RICCO|nr:ATP binding protein, putative [Ricinus communis]
MEIRFDEFPDDARFIRNHAYAAIESYLSSKFTDQVSRLKGELSKKSKSLLLAMDESEAVVDVFDRIKVKWISASVTPKTKSISFRPVHSRRYYVLIFHPKYRSKVLDEYLNYVIEEGKEVGVRNRKRKLYTNNPSNDWWDYRYNLWSHVVFEHPARFETLAMNPTKKQELINDLITFTNGKEYYAKTGKAWKRGYLLYGPPGTGKSSMIAAIANFLSYNVYDIELTAVADNTELRKLLTDISSKSVVVIEDIDCSLDLTGQRKKKDDNKKKDPLENLEKNNDSNHQDDGKKSKVTLSGLLNFIDGLWSASGGERIIIFTTNHKEKLDPALIRSGRMDHHIELSYCKIEAFKILAKNYLNIDSHVLFDKIGQLLEEVDMTPADVVEFLMPKSIEGADADGNLKNLIQGIENKRKEEAKQKAEAEAEAAKEKANYRALKLARSLKLFKKKIY